MICPLMTTSSISNSSLVLLPNQQLTAGFPNTKISQVLRISYQLHEIISHQLHKGNCRYFMSHAQKCDICSELTKEITVMVYLPFGMKEVSPVRSYLCLY